MRSEFEERTWPMPVSASIASAKRTGSRMLRAQYHASQVCPSAGVR